MESRRSDIWTKSRPSWVSVTWEAFCTRQDQVCLLCALSSFLEGLGQFPFSGRIRYRAALGFQSSPEAEAEAEAARNALCVLLLSLAYCHFTYACTIVDSKFPIILIFFLLNPLTYFDTLLFDGKRDVFVHICSNAGVTVSSGESLQL